MTDDDFEWLEPWVPVADQDREGMERELTHELAAGHVLFGRKACAIGRRNDQDDVLFVVDGPRQFAVVHLNVRPRDAVRSWLDALNASPLVEIAYPAPIPVRTAADIAPVTPSCVGSQGYLTAAPYGIDVRFSWTRAGGDGFGRKFIDVQGAWNYTHEDLNPAFVKLGTNHTGVYWIDHGTAVVGMLVGAKNNYGVTGISNAASFGTSSAAVSVAAGVNAAVPHLAAGDVILIEIQYHGPAERV